MLNLCLACTARLRARQHLRTRRAQGDYTHRVFTSLDGKRVLTGSHPLLSWRVQTVMLCKVSAGRKSALEVESHASSCLQCSCIRQENGISDASTPTKVIDLRQLRICVSQYKRRYRGCTTPDKLHFYDPVIHNSPSATLRYPLQAQHSELRLVKERCQRLIAIPTCENRET